MVGKKYKASENVPSKHQSTRIAQLEGLLSHRNVVSKEYLMRELEVSFSTLKRDISYMKDFLDADIEFDREANGYRYKKDTVNRTKIPSTWFTPNEISSLLMMYHLISNMDRGGILGEHVNPMLVRIKAMMGLAEDPLEEIKKRVRIDTRGTRPQNPEFFQIIGQAVLARKTLAIGYTAKGTNVPTERTISPQRMIFYKGNWFVDAYCHLREELRTFAMDSITACDIGEGQCKEIPSDVLAAHYAAGFGIFGGAATKTAKLKFSEERARWVSREVWHKDQVVSYDEQGNYYMEVPYSDHRELLMEILKYGSHCEVLGPDCLKEQYRKEVKAMCDKL